MATAAEPRPVKDDAVVERSIASAAGRVRANDLLTGAAALAVIALAYVALMVILDKWLTLPGWVRQLGFAGFLAAAAAVAYLTVVVPLRRRVNPRYIARRVERTIPDAKNVLINWVDLQDRELPGSVRTAVAARAADGLADADVDTATQSRRLLWLGTAAGVLVATLAVLFLLFKWTQFSSLVSRAVNPFAGTAIASRTQIDLLDPAGGDATVTDGEQLNVAIRIGGRVPDVNGPERPRLLVRHHPDAAGYDELPLTRGESAREFAYMVPRSVIQNGFWYKVAAGDAETPEYRVTVRTRPMLTGFQAEYEYPAYLKWPNDYGTDARLRAYRGTVVTLTVTTNREVQSGTLRVTAGGQVESIRGQVTGERTGSLRFPLTLTATGTYQVHFVPAGGEPAFFSPEYPIEVQEDEKPRVTITRPKEEITLPPNGLLAVDAEITDDFGVRSAGLSVQFRGDPVVVPGRDDRKPFVRAKDGTFETAVRDFKTSVKLDALVGANGKPLGLKEGDTLEYSVWATDNCEPVSNAGRSKAQRVRIGPTPTPEQQKQQQQREEQRKGEERQAQQQQEERQKNDTRPPDQARNPDPAKQPDQPPEGGEKKDGDPKGGEGQPDQKQGGGEAGKQDANPMGANNPNEKTQDPKPDNPKPDNPKGGGENGTNDKPEKTDNPMGAGEKGTNDNPDTKANPDGKQGEKKDGSPGGGSGGKSDQELQKQADQLKERIDEKKSEPGDARGDGSDAPAAAETKPDAGTKPPPDPKGGEKGAAEEKTGEKSGDPKADASKAGEGKDSGTLTDPNRATEKAPPKKDAKGDQQPAGEQPKAGPKTGSESAGESKESKPEQGGQPSGDPKGKKDAAGSAKGVGPEQGGKSEQPQPKGGGNESSDKGDAKNPDDLSGAKEKGTPERGSTKKEETGSKGGAAGNEPQPKDEKADGGEAKGDKPAPPGVKKDAQPDKRADGSQSDKNGPPPDVGQEKGPPKQDAVEPMNPMKQGDESAEGKGEGRDGKPDDKSATKPPMTEKGNKTGGKPDDQKGDGSKPDAADAEAGGRDRKDPKADQQPAAGGQDQKQKLDPKEVEKAVRNLESNDPKERQAAREKLDKAVGKQTREEIEKLQKDLKSDDQATRDAAKRKMEEMAKTAGEQSGKPDGKPRELTELEKKELADAAKNLNSKDEGERKAAEQKIDSAIGEEKRKEVQETLRDLTGDDPAKAQAAKEKLEQMAKDAKNDRSGKELDERTRKLGGGNLDKEGKPIEANLENQLKTNELTLRQLKDMRDNKEFLKENNFTPEEYARFLKGYEEMVNRTRDELDQRRLNPSAAAKPPGPAAIRNDGSTDRVVGRTPEVGSAQGPGGASVAPPGFAEAQRRYAEQAAKREAEKSRQK
jgi:hypothetical protein